MRMSVADVTKVVCVVRGRAISRRGVPLRAARFGEDARLRSASVWSGYIQRYPVFEIYSSVYIILFGKID